jgi:carbon storage regulator CsrA
MLVLTRRLEEKIFFPSIGAYVQVLAIKGGQVRLGIDAPSEVLVLRAEVPDSGGVGSSSSALSCD